MKKIFFMALVAMSFFSSCSEKETGDTKEESKLKSLEFSLEVASPTTRMSDGSVTDKAAVAAAVRAGITDITVEYFNGTGSLGTYQLTNDQVITVKSDNQTGDRKPVRIKDIPAATTKVNVYMNVKAATDINDLQTSYNVMEYRGKNAVSITLKAVAGGDNGRDLYEVEVGVTPVLSRFEFSGTVSDIVINQDGNGTLPTGITDGTQADAQKHVKEGVILAAEAAARDAWKVANPGAADPTWAYTYTVAYAYDPAYNITSIDGYYMNNIPLTKGGALVLNANDATGNWNADGLASYNATTGSMKKMFDTTVEADKTIAYNLFPQTFTPAVAGAATVNEVKQHMPHFILKLTTSKTSQATQWITIRALRNTATGEPLITSFEPGKVYVLDAAQIKVNQYSAKLSVTANGAKGPDIIDPIDPVDPNPEPQGKDLDLLVKVLDWEAVYVKPEF